jgi:hypothetical protein
MDSNANEHDDDEAKGILFRGKWGNCQNDKGYEDENNDKEEDGEEEEEAEEEIIRIRMRHDIWPLWDRLEAVNADIKNDVMDVIHMIDLPHLW